MLHVLRPLPSLMRGDCPEDIGGLAGLRHTNHLMNQADMLEFTRVTHSFVERMASIMVLTFLARHRQHL